MSERCEDTVCFLQQHYRGVEIPPQEVLQGLIVLERNFLRRLALASSAVVVSRRRRGTNIHRVHFDDDNDSSCWVVIDDEI
jgi:hypothetical protein